MKGNIIKKVLVTGANGFIGSIAVKFLRQLGYEVHAVYHHAPLSEKNVPGITNYSCNLLNFNKRKELLEKIKATHLLHFAWYTVPGKYWTSQENFLWVKASQQMLMSFIENGGRRAVLAGTCAEYDWSNDYCSEYLTPAQPASLYGKCKNNLRRSLETVSLKKGLSYAWGRIFFLYGPGEAQKRLIPSVITALLQGRLAQCSHGNQIRDFMYVEDMASAFVSLLESDVNGIVNIASGQPVSLKKMIYSAADMIGRRDLVQLGALPSPLSEPEVLLADVKRLEQEVGWKQNISLEEGLMRTVAWWKENKCQK